MKPKSVIFSSSEEYSIAEGVYNNLKDHHDVVLWRQFFGKNRTTPLWTFFKNLFQYDYAILILSPDSVVWDQVNEDVKGYVPKDNVIFELGATMARLGPQKTILISPDKPNLAKPELTVQLPSYFDDVEPLHFTYERRLKTPKTRKDKMATTKAASEQIIAILNRVSFDDFHSELPGQGLAFGYLQNFIKPVFDVPKAPEAKSSGVSETSSQAVSEVITLTAGLKKKLVIVIPEDIFDVKNAQTYFKNYPELQNATLHKEGRSRDIGVYIWPRKSDLDTLYIFDIPTTLHTARHFVWQVEQFWRDKDHVKVKRRDDKFIRQLIAREILNFSRILEHEVGKDKLDVDIVEGKNLRDYLSRLQIPD